MLLDALLLLIFFFLDFSISSQPHTRRGTIMKSGPLIRHVLFNANRFSVSQSKFIYQQIRLRQTLCIVIHHWSMEPKDWCTMSVASLGPATLEKQQPRFPNGIVRSMDIEQEPTFAKTFTEFRETFNSSADISGASPKKNLSHPRNCFHTLLVVDDIPGTRPKEKSKMLTTGRHVNPLQPSYSLPTFYNADFEQPKFLRDSMSVADIDGAQTSQRKLPSVRNALDTTDIVGAQASWKPRHR